MSAFFLLEDLTPAVAAPLGLRAQELAAFRALGLPQAPTVCVTPSALRMIADANNLKLKLTQLISATRFADPVEQTRFNKHLETLFRHLKMPEELSKELVHLYLHYFHESPVRIVPSESLFVPEPELLQVIHGEANLVESFFDLWRQLVQHAVHFSDSTRPIHQVLFPSPLLIEQLVKAVSTGSIYSLQPFTGDKTQYYIESRWGVGGEEKDIILVDSRTLQCVQRSIGVQTKQTTRTGSGMVQTATPLKQQSQPSLPDSAAQQLATYTQHIKRSHLNHQRITWEFDGRAVIVTGRQDFEVTIHQAPAPAQQSQHRVTKLWVSSGNPAKASEHVTAGIDGLGILRSEYTFAAFGEHPLHILRSRTPERIEKQLAQTISSYRQVLKQRPLMYRALNLTSAEMMKLEHATSFENDERNPYLGVRGGLRTKLDPSIFLSELRALKRALESSGAPLQLLIPFVRTPAELQTCLLLIAKTGLHSFPHFSVWLQLNTPENILNLTAYPLEHIAGVSINVRSIHGLLMGFDPDDSTLTEEYPLELQVLLGLIRKVIATLRQPLHIQSTHSQKQVVLHLEQYHPRLLEAAIEMGITGVTVKPKVAAIARACIMDAESLVVRACLAKSLS